MTSPFDHADSPGRDPDAPQFDQKEHLGSLLVLQVRSTEEGVETEYGPANVIVADVHVISPDATISASYEETWIFGTVLFSQLKRKVGRTVVGVLAQGEKRPGKNPPWRLDDPTDAQEQAAVRAMMARPDAPATEQPAAPAPRSADPWTAPAAAVAGGKAPWE